MRGCDSPCAPDAAARCGWRWRTPTCAVEQMYLKKIKLKSPAYGGAAPKQIFGWSTKQSKQFALGLAALLGLADGQQRDQVRGALRPGIKFQSSASHVVPRQPRDATRSGLAASLWSMSAAVETVIGIMQHG